MRSDTVALLSIEARPYGVRPAANCCSRCPSARASPNTPYFPGKQLNIFKTFSVLDWQSLNLAHEVRTGAAPRQKDCHDFVKSSGASCHFFRASSIELRVWLGQPIPHLFPRLEGHESCVIKRHQSLIVRTSKFAAYRRRIQPRIVLTRLSGR